MKNLVSIVRATQPSSSVARTGNPLMGEGVIERNPKAQGEEAHGERASPLSQQPFSSPKLEAPSKSRGAAKPMLAV